MRLPPPPETLLPELCRCLHAHAVSERLWQAVRRHAPTLLRDLRGRLGWSQQELAERLGCDLATVAKVEAGHGRLARETAVRLGEVLTQEGLIVGVLPGGKG